MCVFARVSARSLAHSIVLRVCFAAHSLAVCDDTERLPSPPFILVRVCSHISTSHRFYILFFPYIFYILWYRQYGHSALPSPNTACRTVHAINTIVACLFIHVRFLSESVLNKKNNTPLTQTPSNHALFWCFEQMLFCTPHIHVHLFGCVFSLLFGCEFVIQ